VRLVTIAVSHGEHHVGDGAVGTLESGEFGDVDGDGDAEVDTAAPQRVRSAGEHDATEHVALTHGVHLGGAGRDDDLVGVYMEHVFGGADHDERPGVHTDDVVAGG
jgi:hypothetical protein